MHALSAGAAGGIIFLAQAYAYRTYDKECTYPKAGCKWTALASVLAVILALAGTGAVPSAILSGFLTFAAFTDCHTGYLYSMSSLVAGLGGAACLLALHGIHGTLCILLGLLPFVALLLIYRLTHAMNTGDVEVMAALSVWLAYVSDKPGMGWMEISVPAISALLLASFLCAAWTLGGRRARTVPFAPYILPAAAFAIICCQG